MSKLLATKLYLQEKLHELDTNEVSNLLYMDTFNQIIRDLALVKVKIADEDNVLTLFCSLPPLLTALLCIKGINLEKVTVSLQTVGINKSIPRNIYGNKDDKGDRWLEVISWEPRAFLYHNFLTNEECDHLISLAKPRMVRSLIRDRVTGRNVESSLRTSTEASFRRGHDKIIREIERKISEFTFIPVENGEGLQVLRYEVGQEVGRHHDENQRIATVLMYLSDVEEGGETVLLEAKGDVSDGGISVPPKKRDALLFWNMKPDGSIDPLSVHAGSPVIKGTNWACTKWFHHLEYIA